MPFQPYYSNNADVYDAFMQMYRELNAKRAMQAQRVRPRDLDPLREEHMWEEPYIAAAVNDQNKKNK